MDSPSPGLLSPGFFEGIGLREGSASSRTQNCRRSFGRAQSRKSTVCDWDAPSSRLRSGTGRACAESTSVRHRFGLRRFPGFPRAGIRPIPGPPFVIRLAGNFVDDNGLASAEYGIVVLGASLVVVLGHSECGAIKSTIDVITKNKELPGHLPTLVS